MKKKVLSTILAGVLALSTFAGCGSSAEESTDTSAVTKEETTVAATEETVSAESTESTDTAAEGGTIKVAASATPHAEILEEAKKILADEGWDLEIKIFDDYVMPNEVVESGEFDANYFQHVPYLESFNEEKGTHLVNAGGIHYEPFGIYPGTKKTLDELEEIQRFRISSIEPNLLTDDIIRFVASSRRFMPHFHVPLQSGSNEVLHLMRRRYERELFAEKVQEIKTLIPDAFIGVDVIAGMRGETPEAFEDARQFIAGLDVSQLHVFPYSERSGTKALDIPYIVPQAEKHRRVNTLLDISEQKLHDFYTAHVGQTRPVLFEESDIAGSIGGFTDNYIRVEIPYDPSLANQIVPVELKTDIFGS